MRVQQDSLWQTVLGEIEVSLSRGNFMTWFKNTTLLRQDENLLVIGVPNVFVKQQLEKKYNDLVLQTLKRNGVADITVEYKIHVLAKKRTETEDSVLVPQQQPAPIRPTAVRKAPARSALSHDYRKGLNEKYTFQNFVVGSGNELAYAACQAVAQNPGSRYNPLFLYGGVGIGKTHLMQAVGNETLRKNPGANIVYASTEQFVQEFVDALRFKKNTDFAAHYRGADVLIVDDVQFLEGKEKIQEEFFHTFNALHQANKQIIISSDRPPKEIPTLEERLRSRFVWGMSIDMQSPDLETRTAIVQEKAHTNGIEVDHETAEFLAKTFPSNIRELEGALNQLLAYCEMREVSPNISIAQSVIGTSSRPRHISAKMIIEKVAKFYQVSLENVLGPKRDKEIVLPRQVAMYLLRSELHLSFPKIAHELGRKDHTTALHSVEKITKELAENDELRASIEQIKEQLHA